jgi:hypothetical protein
MKPGFNRVVRANRVIHFEAATVQHTRKIGSPRSELAPENGAWMVREEEIDSKLSIK